MDSTLKIVWDKCRIMVPWTYFIWNPCGKTFFSSLYHHLIAILSCFLLKLLFFTNWINASHLYISNWAFQFPEVSQPGKPLKTTENLKTWRLGISCPIFRKPHWRIRSKNLENLWKTVKPTGIYVLVNNLLSVKNSCRKYWGSF